MSTPKGSVPDDLVLAAIERAERHRARDTPGVPVWEVVEHLDIARRSGRGRNVRALLDVLVAAGLLVRSRRRGVSMWALTRAGRRRLRRAQATGGVAVLPESPQHRAWRKAQTLAGREIELLRAAVGDAMIEAFFLLEPDQPTESDTWFEIAERLHRACRSFGSAAYCLHEWAEPDDAQADIDDRREPGDEELDQAEQRRLRARRAGRRNVARWQDG